MFRTLRLEYGLTQQQVADATHRTPNYILKAEDLTFPSPPPALVQFYAEIDGAYDKELLTNWYYEAQQKRREQWLEDYIPAPRLQQTFRDNWIKVGVEDWEVPTQYRLSKGLCLQASVVYNMDKYPHRKLPAAVGVALDQLISYTTSGRFTMHENFSYDLVGHLVRLKEHFL